jgi:hypothetical protein
MIDWTKPIVFSDGRPARYWGRLGSSGSLTHPDREQDYAECYAEWHDYGARHLVYRGDEPHFRAFNDKGFQVQVYIEGVYDGDNRDLRVIQDGPKPLDSEGFEGSEFWGQF